MISHRIVLSKKRTTRNISIDEYRKKLLSKIADASSDANVRRFVDAAIKAMNTHRVNGHIVARFIEKVSEQLNEDLTDTNSRRQKNFAIAKSMIPSIKRKLFNRPEDKGPNLSAH